MKPYSCKAYAYIHNRPKLDKIAAKAYVRYLVGYESTNIWRIWIPSLGRVIAIRDVTFDITQRYSPRDDLIIIDDTEADLLQVDQIDLSDADDDKTFNFDRVYTQGVGQEHEKSIDAPGDIVIVDIGLLTPRDSPEPTDTTTTDQITSDI